MVSAAQFCSMVKSYGLNFSTGVPCSVLKDVIHCLSLDPDIPYIPAIREDEAIGIATGAYLAGRKPIVLMQNSGLGNSIDALTSLAITYRIPILLLISWRGYQGKDAPHHLVMGKATVKLLEDIGISVQIIPEEGVEKALSVSIKDMEARQIPVAMLLRRGIIA